MSWTRKAAFVIAWGQELEVGVEFMDAEHCAISLILAAMGRTAEAGQGPALLDALLKRLVLTVDAHFAHEEREMRERAYPMASGHAVRHAEFAAALAKLRARHDAGEDVLAVQVVRFVKEWFALHIQESDKPLAGWLIDAEHASVARGVTARA